MRSLRVGATLTVVAIIAVVAIIGVDVGAQSGAEKEVLQAATEHFRANVAGDMITLEKRVADELWYCRPSGLCEDKLHYLKFSSGVSPMSLTPEALKVDVFAADTAMLTGRLRQVMNSEGPGARFYYRTPIPTTGKPKSGMYFSILELWVKRAGRWQLTKYQATNRPEANPFCSGCYGEYNEPDWAPHWHWRGVYDDGTEGAAEQEVLRTQAERLAAVEARDTKTLQGLVAKELRYCSNSGSCLDRTEYLAAAPGAKFLSIRPERMRVNIYGNTATVVGWYTMITGGTSEKPSAETTEILEILVKRDGRWQLAGFTATDPNGWNFQRCRYCKNAG